MKVLVGYASANGSTKGVAARIAEILTGAGMDVDLRPIGDIAAVDPYDAVVLGSAIHNQAWLNKAATFVADNATALAGRPVWLFSVSSVGDSNSFFGERVARLMRRMRQEPKGVAGYRQAVRARGHRNFTGAVERGQWGRGGHLFLKAFGGRYGDHRDWADIEAWAAGIVDQLHQQAVSGSAQVPNRTTSPTPSRIDPAS